MGPTNPAKRHGDGRYTDIDGDENGESKEA
jgi:hypothetical protein